MCKPDEAGAISILTLYGVFGSDELGQALELAKMVEDYYDEFRKIAEG